MIVLVIFSIIFGCLGFLWLYFHRIQTQYSHPLLVRAKGIPILGNLLDFSPDRMIEAFVRYAREYGPFVEYYLLTFRGLLISDVEIGKEILLKNPKKFVRLRQLNYPTRILNMETSLFMAEGSIWTRIRKATSPSFSLMNVVNKFPSMIVEMRNWMMRIHQSAKKYGKERIFDMKYETFSLTIRIISVVGFGMPLDHPVNDFLLSAAANDAINKGFRYIFEASFYPFPRWTWKYSSKFFTEREAVEAGNISSKACQEIIDYKRQLYKDSKEIPKHQSMIDSLLFYHDEQSTSEKALSDEEIIANMKTFYLAGTDTTAVTISWVSYYFAVQPEILKKVRGEVEQIIFPDVNFKGLDLFSKEGEELMRQIDLPILKELHYCQAVLKETLRLKGPASSLGVELADTTETLTLSNGIVIYPHDFVWVSLDGIHYSERYFENAYAFNPERWLIKDEAKLQELESHFLPFGHGPRICPGMNLALNEVILAIVFLAMHYDFELGCPVEEVKRKQNFASIPNKMPMKLIPKRY